MIRTLQTQSYMPDGEGGQILQALGASVSIEASLEQTGGVFNRFEAWCPVWSGGRRCTMQHRGYGTTAPIIHKLTTSLGSKEKRGSN